MGGAAIIYYLVVVIIGAFAFLNLWLAVIANRFQESAEEQREELAEATNSCVPCDASVLPLIVSALQ